MCQVRPLAELAGNDERMYHQLCMHLNNLYRHFASDGKVPLTFLPESAPEAEIDASRLSLVLGRSWLLDTCPTEANLEGSARESLGPKIR